MPILTPAGLAAVTKTAVVAHLEWMYRMTTRRPLRVMVVSFILLALSVASICSIRFETDFFKLFPSQHGALRLFLDTLNWSGSSSEAYFLLEGDRESLLKEGEAFAGKLKSLQVDGQPAFQKVIYRTFDPAEAASFANFISYAVTKPQLFLSPGQVPDYAAKLQRASMDAALKRAQAELASQAGMAARDVIAADPLYLRDLVLPRLKKASQALDLDPTSPYFISRDGRVLIIIAQTTHSVQDLDFARKLVEGINVARRGFTVHISCTGAQIAAVIDEATMKQNVLESIVISLAVVLGIFYLTYRRVMPTLLLPIILLFGVGLSLGTAGLFLRSIHIISFAFMSLIIGIGTDYSIHIYDRFHAERAAGVDTREALRLALIQTGHGVYTSAATTAVPFLMLMVSDVRALFELGLLVGLGVIFSMYASFLFLPPLLIYAERRFPNVRYQPLPDFGMASVWQFSRQRPVRIVVVSLLLIGALLVAGCFISFEEDLKNLQPKHSEAFLTAQKIENHLSLSPKQMMVAVEGKGIEEVLARGGEVDRLLDRYLREGRLAGYSSLEQVINDKALQGEVLRDLQSALAGRMPGDDLRRELEKSGFAVDPFQPAIDGLNGLGSASPVSALDALSHLSESPLRGVVERHLMKGGGVYHLLFYLYYRGPEFSQSTFLTDLKGADPSARTTSPDLVSLQLKESVRRSFTLAFILGGAVVLFLLVSHFKTLAGLLFTLYPVVGGVIAMVGLMVLTGMRLNFMNAMVLVTIVGMGSDYGIHVINRVISHDEEVMTVEFVQAGRSVLLSAFTTIAGFGSLAFSDYGALASIGSATNYGVGATALLALASLPAFMAIWGTKRLPSGKVTPPTAP